MKKIILLFSLIAMIASSVVAQSVVVNAEIDSCQRLIGEQARIKLQVTCDANRRLLMPNYDKDIIDGIEIVEKVTPDTQFLNDGKRISITQEYVVTSFDSSLYVIPPFEVLVEGDPYYSQELALAVYTVPVDTVNVEQFFGPKDIWSVSLTFGDWAWSIVYFLAFIVFIAILVWVTIRYINNKPIIRIVKVKPKMPAHVVALNDIEKIKSDGSWRVSGDTKEYYTALTDTLRIYLNERFGFNATEMTTGEIIDNLLKIKDKESIRELQELLVMADLVKLAKYNPPMNENDRNLVAAIDFVNSTKLADTEENPQPVEKKIVDERSVTAKRLLLLSIVLLSVTVSAFLILLILELYHLLS